MCSLLLVQKEQGQKMRCTIITRIKNYIKVSPQKLDMLLFMSRRINLEGKSSKSLVTSKIKISDDLCLYRNFM